MGKLPETKEGTLREKEGWENIVHSDDWVVYRRLLAEHAEYLQKESNDFLRKQDFTNAFGSLKAMDDAKKFLELVRIRISELHKLSEKGM